MTNVACLALEERFPLFLSVETDSKTMRFSIGEENVFLESFHQPARSNDTVRLMPGILYHTNNRNR